MTGWRKNYPPYSQQLLIISNAGAHYPPHAETNFTNTLFHSLNDCLYSYMTGRLCGELTDHKKAIVATSFYDGGYQHCHAMTTAYTKAGGEIQFNFVSHFKKELFTINPLAAFIQSNPAINTLLCLYSGDMARCFYEQIAPLQQQYNLQLFGSPMLFDNTPGDFAETNPFVKQIKGYTGYTTLLPNEQNLNFIDFFKKEYNKEANLFSLQGWEAALLMIYYLQHQTVGVSALQAIEKLKQKPVPSPRGAVRVNNSNVVTGPAYLVNAEEKLQIEIKEVIEDTLSFYNDMISLVPGTSFSTWQNTYLCI
jgi:branched-chain amino acid transport system substrate-binding protein